MYYIALILLFIAPCYALNFVIPLPNTLILTGTSSLVTWTGLDNVTATNLYLGNGANKDQLTIIKIFDQNIPSSKKSMWITLPKDTPSDNTYLVLEGNDTPPSRATVPLNVGLGSTTTPSAVPTASSSSTSASPSSSSNPSPSSSVSTKTDQPSISHSETSSSGEATATDTQPSTPNDKDSSIDLSSGQVAGVIIGSMGTAGLILGAIFFSRRKRRLNSRKRHTELFDEKDDDHSHFTPPIYSRSFGPTQPSPLYHMKTIDSTDRQVNGFQSRTQISPDLPIGAGPMPLSAINKPDEVTLKDYPDKPHSKT